MKVKWDDILFPIYGKIIQSCSKPPTRYPASISNTHWLQYRVDNCMLYNQPIISSCQLSTFATCRIYRSIYIVFFLTFYSFYFFVGISLSKYTWKIPSLVNQKKDVETQHVHMISYSIIFRGLPHGFSTYLTMKTPGAQRMDKGHPCLVAMIRQIFMGFIDRFPSWNIPPFFNRNISWNITVISNVLSVFHHGILTNITLW